MSLTRQSETQRKLTCSRESRIKEKIQNHFHTTRAPGRPSVLQETRTSPNVTEKEDVAQHRSGRSLQALVRVRKISNPGSVIYQLGELAEAILSFGGSACHLLNRTNHLFLSVSWNCCEAQFRRQMCFKNVGCYYLPLLFIFYLHK